MSGVRGWAMHEMVGFVDPNRGLGHRPDVIYMSKADYQDLLAWTTEERPKQHPPEPPATPRVLRPFDPLWGSGSTVG